MVDVDKSVIARLKVAGKNFEVVVDCNNALKLKEGKAIDMTDVLAFEDIFTDNKKGTRAAESELKKSFGTNNIIEIAKQIIIKGEVQLTAEHRKRIRDEKTKRIIDIIKRNGIDPRTNLPHPATRIVNAIEEAKVKVDENKSAEAQIEHIVKQLMPILPIRFAVQEISARIPAQYAAKVHPIAKQYGTIVKEQWEGDGSLYIIVELAAGLQEEYMNKLNALSRGNVDVKIIKTK